MSGKRVQIGLKPSAQKSAEDWVTQSDQATVEETPTIVMKRLTIDVPEDLHRRLKVKAATDGMKMADMVRRWIETGCAE